MNHRDSSHNRLSRKIKIQQIKKRKDLENFSVRFWIQEQQDKLSSLQHHNHQRTEEDKQTVNKNENIYHYDYYRATNTSDKSTSNIHHPDFVMNDLSHNHKSGENEISNENPTQNERNRMNMDTTTDTLREINLLNQKEKLEKQINHHHFSKNYNTQPKESTHQEFSFIHRLIGTNPFSSSAMETKLSTWTGRRLKPVLWKDTESVPSRVLLLQEIHSKQRNQVPYKLSSINYVHLNIDILNQVNECLCRQFWPTIDVTEQLQYPDFSVVAMYKKLVIGCAFMTPDCYITYITVKPGWERAGIAKFMIYFLAKNAGNRDITLHVSANNPAMILYQQMGFKPEEFIVGFYDKYHPADSKQCKNAFFIRLRKS